MIWQTAVSLFFVAQKAHSETVPSHHRPCSLVRLGRLVIVDAEPIRFPS